MLNAFPAVYLIGISVNALKRKFRQNFRQSYLPFSGVSAQNTTVEEEDFCMQKMEVIVIIVTFSVALIVMIILVLVLVMRLVKSRVKVVDAPKFSGEANRYNLPRLSLATT